MGCRRETHNLAVGGVYYGFRKSFNPSYALSHAASPGESGMSIRNFTGQLVGASSIVSSSARKAA
jgi:hypothetical protein